MFGDWQLAIAAYNCGPGNVRKAIRRSGGKTNFWEIYNYLPRETRGYLPAFIAATYVFHYYQEHNIPVANLDLPMVTDTIVVDKRLHFEDLSKAMNISVDLIKALNPQYRMNVVPAQTGKPYLVILPMAQCLAFCEVSDTLYKQSASTTVQRTVAPVSHSTSAKSAGKSAVYYTVKSGDNLGYIADWFDTYVSYIKSWNGIYGSNIRVGKKLVLYVSPSKVEYYSAIDKMSFEEKKNISSHSKFVSNNNTSTTDQVSESTGEGYFFYTFRNGDSLWELSRRYPSNSVSDIKRINNISDVRNIKAGQKLKLKRD